MHEFNTLTKVFLIIQNRFKTSLQVALLVYYYNNLMPKGELLKLKLSSASYNFCDLFSIKNTHSESPRYKPDPFIPEETLTF
ncbi:MAG: hypothetical protein ACJAXY_000618 [Nonlabens sp.]|jgi:hypothetical protein